MDKDQGVLWGGKRIFITDWCVTCGRGIEVKRLSAVATGRRGVAPTLPSPASSLLCHLGTVHHSYSRSVSSDNEGTEVVEERFVVYPICTGRGIVFLECNEWPAILV